MDWTLPARPLSPPDRAEEHEEARCWSCGHLIHPIAGCYCTTIDLKIRDQLERDR